jgi:hypothetical protein
VTFAAEFLQAAGKSTLLHQVSRLEEILFDSCPFQSDELDDDLRTTLKSYRVTRQTAMIDLDKSFLSFYRYLPIDYVQSSSLNVLKDHLNDLQTTFNSDK